GRGAKGVAGWRARGADPTVRATVQPRIRIVPSGTVRRRIPARQSHARRALARARPGAAVRLRRSAGPRAWPPQRGRLADDGLAGGRVCADRRGAGRPAAVERLLRRSGPPAWRLVPARAGDERRADPDDPRT